MFAASHLPSSQNNLYAKVAYAGVILTPFSSLFKYSWMAGTRVGAGVFGAWRVDGCRLLPGLDEGVRKVEALEDFPSGTNHCHLYSTLSR